MVIISSPGLRVLRRRMESLDNLYKKKTQRDRKNKEKKKKKKKKKMNKSRGSGDNDDTSNPISRLLGNDGDIIGIATPSNSSSLFDQDVLREILSRLPVKSLMRFKCVCKLWWFLIQRDQHFHDLHLTRSITRPGLLIVTPLLRCPKRDLRGGPSFKGRLHENCFLSADLLFEGRAAASFHTIRTLKSLLLKKIMRPVNGLICFIDSRVFAVRIYNLCTREVTPWIKSTLLMEETEEHDFEAVHPCPITYGFGFDPATKEHKVICMWRISTIKTLRGRKLIAHSVVCEVLTVGHNSWRRIDEVPPRGLNGASVYANGSIYWKNFKFLNDEWDDDDDPAVIVAFDVGSEKFRVIPIPNFVLDQTRSFDAFVSRCAYLLEVDRRVALLRRMSSYTFKLWIFDDDSDKKENRTTTTTSGTSNRNWIEETITLPYCWDKYRVYSFHAVPGTDQLILESYRDFRRHLNFVSLYSYNRKKKTFEKVGVSGIPSCPDLYRSSLFTTFVESLLPVQKKQQQHHTQPLPGK